MKPLKSPPQPRLNPFTVALNLLTSLHLSSSSLVTRVKGMLRARDVPSLARLGDVQDLEYQDSEVWDLLQTRSISSLFKKNSEFSDLERCSAAAREGFAVGEKRCRIANRRLDWFYMHQDRVDPLLLGWLRRMEQDISSLLGDILEWESSLASRIRLTNGATEDRSRARSLPFLKISRHIRGPAASVRYIGNLLISYGVDISSCRFTKTERNVLVLVPKNWKTFRTIAKEPTHSLPFQLSLDSFLKDKLRKWGIDLSSQSANQEKARLGSIDGSFATLDLEMASDTLSFNAVAWMLPTEWLNLFGSFRSSLYSAPWGNGTYAKYASMGNGYTFSLETLIFTAACRAVGSRQYSVYGDDIAVETEYAVPVIKLLRFLGFRVNMEKSFTNPDSRFRESCGCDYYKGELVTPFYLRECPKDTDFPGWSHAINGLVASVSGPSPLWDWAADQVQRLRLRLVPCNEDTRSGVFVTPNYAWKTKKLFVIGHQTSTLEGPSYGFPGFKGYGPVQVRRTTAGRRSLFLWFLERNRGSGCAPIHVSKSAAGFYLQLNARRYGRHADESIETSSVIIASRYVHKTRRFVPQPLMTPSHLYLWDEVIHRSRRA